MKIKRIAAIILVFSLLTAMITVAKAEELPSAETMAVQETSATAPEEGSTEGTAQTTQIAEETAPPAADESVAEMSVCMRASGFPAYFHVWIYIHNISDSVLNVGPYELPVNEGVSVGTWGMTFHDRWGVYYNMESYASENRTADDYYSLTKEISMQELEAASNEITRWDYWDFFFNCTFFASRVWNSVGEKYILPIPLPLITLLQMAILGAEKNALDMFAPEKERVFKQVGSAEGAVLEPVDSHMLGSFVASLNVEKGK